MKSMFSYMFLLTPWLVVPNVAPSPAIWPWIVSLACLGGLFLTQSLASLGSNEDSVSVILAAWLTAGLLNSLIALAQYFGVEQLFSFMSDAQPGEAFGNLRQRNHFATLTNIGLVALLFRLRWHLRDTNGRTTAVLSAAAIFLVLGNAASASRSGFLGLLLIVGFVVVWSHWRELLVQKVLIHALVAYAVGGWLLPALAGNDAANNSIYARLSTTATDCASRLTLWSNMLELIAERPWLGWGWGELDYAHFMKEYAGVRQCELLDNAHNLPLHLAVELGIPVTLLMFGAFAWLMVRTRPWQEKSPARQCAWLVLALIMLHSMVEYPLWFGPFSMTTSLCILLLCSMDERSRIGRSGGPAKAVQVAGGALLLVAAYAAWDYHRISQIYLPHEKRAPGYRQNTLEKIRGSWLFGDQVRFAEYTLTPTTRNNAEQLYAMGLQLLHYSPEARVVEKVIESAVLLGRDKEARLYLARYKAAYPQEHALWAAGQREPAEPQ